MTSMKRFELAALCGVVLSLLLGSPARAEVDLGTINLTNAGPEPGASGQATLTRVKLVGVEQWLSFDGTTLIFEAHHRGYLTVKCKGLTPGRSYRTPAGTCKADRNGNVVVNGWAHYWFQWFDYVGPNPDEFKVHVSRLNPDGTATIVLDGGFPYESPFPF